MAKETIVLIHGMWMTPHSWDRWLDYADRGFHAIAPGWPGVKGPEETRRDPSALKGLGLKKIVDHYEQIIRGLDPADHHGPTRSAGSRRSYSSIVDWAPPESRSAPLRRTALFCAAVDSALRTPSAEEPVRPERPRPPEAEAVSLPLHEYARTESNRIYNEHYIPGTNRAFFDALGSPKEYVTPVS